MEPHGLTVRLFGLFALVRCRSKCCKPRGSRDPNGKILLTMEILHDLICQKPTEFWQQGTYWGMRDLYHQQYWGPSTNPVMVSGTLYHHMWVLGPPAEELPNFDIHEAGPRLLPAHASAGISLRLAGNHHTNQCYSQPCRPQLKQGTQKLRIAR